MSDKFCASPATTLQYLATSGRSHNSHAFNSRSPDLFTYSYSFWQRSPKVSRPTHWPMVQNTVHDLSKQKLHTTQERSVRRFKSRRHVAQHLTRPMQALHEIARYSRLQELACCSDCTPRRELPTRRKSYSHFPCRMSCSRHNPFSINTNSLVLSVSWLVQLEPNESSLL